MRDTCSIPTGPRRPRTGCAGSSASWPRGGTRAASRGRCRPRCLVEPGTDPEIDLRVRFLQVQARTVEDSSFQPVETLDVGDRTLVTWEEGVEQRVDATAISLADLLDCERQIPIEIPGLARDRDRSRCGWHRRGPDRARALADLRPRPCRRRARGRTDQDPGAHRKPDPWDGEDRGTGPAPLAGGGPHAAGRARRRVRLVARSAPAGRDRRCHLHQPAHLAGPGRRFAAHGM